MLFCDYFFFYRKALLTSKCNLLCYFIEQYLLPWQSCCVIKYFTRIRTIHNLPLTSFVACRYVWCLLTVQLALPLLVSFAIGGAISVQSIIYLTKQPFCFCGNPNNHILPMWLILLWWGTGRIASESSWWKKAPITLCYGSKSALFWPKMLKRSTLFSCYVVLHARK